MSVCSPAMRARSTSSPSVLRASSMFTDFMPPTLRVLRVLCKCLARDNRRGCFSRCLGDLGEDQDIDLIGKARAGVAEHGANDLRVDPGCLAQAGRAMPEVVEPEGRQPGPVGERLEAR